MPVIIGSLGVGLLLVAFALNLVKVLQENSRLYLMMNVAGALMASWYAYTGGAVPFVILELVWAVAALARLVGVLKRA